MADLIPLETNHEARRKVRQWNDDNSENRREWNEVDSTEIKTFNLLCLYAGLHKSNHEAVPLLWWSENQGRPMFTATMSRNRFTSILKFLRFDNGATRQERQAYDKLAQFRDLWSLFQVQLPTSYICCELIQPNSPVRIVVAVGHGRPCNYPNLSTIKVTNSSFFSIWFSVWFVKRQEIKRLELVYSESFLFELLRHWCRDQDTA